MFDNLRKFLTYIDDVAELLPYLAFVLFRIPLGLTIIQILALDLGTDTLPALALGGEAHSTGMMSSPRSRKDSYCPDVSLIRVYLFLGLIRLDRRMSAFFLVLISAGWHLGSIRPARPTLPPGHDGLLRGCGAHPGSERLLMP